MDTTLQAEDLEKLFRQNMRARRKELGMSQVDLAKAMGVNQPYVSQLESGERSPQLETIAKVAEALSTTPDALLTPGVFSVHVTSR